MLAGVLRLVVNHHVTFFINSLAHGWGQQPYTDQNTSRDNPILAFFTYGEGYHNFHHLFASDYRNGIRWWQWDPTKWLIRSMSMMGLASKLRITPSVAIEQARLLTLKAAYMMDTVGNKAAAREIAMIKVIVPNMSTKIIDMAIQAHGGGGVCQDFGLASAYAGQRTLRLADGPDEVHRNAIAKLELRRYN